MHTQRPNIRWYHFVGFFGTFALVIAVTLWGVFADRVP